MTAPIPFPDNETLRLEHVQQMCPIDDTPDATLDRIVDLTAAYFKAPIVLISIVDENRQWFRARLGLGLSGTTRRESFCTYAVATGEYFEVPNALEDPRFSTNPLVTGEVGVRFYAGMPLVTEEGFSLGSLCVLDTVPRSPLTEDERHYLEGMAQLALHRMYDLRRTNFIDSTTGLFNRARLSEDIERRAGMPGEFFLVVLEMLSPEYHNQFIQSLGHVFDEHVMLRIRQRLATLLPDGVELYRVSSTRLAFFLDQPPASEIDRLLERIVEAFEQPVETDHIPIYTQLGMGVLSLSGDQPWSSDWLRRAINAASTARSNGMGWSFYCAEQDARQKRAFELLSHLADAIRAPDELRLVFQPRLELVSGECNTVEALLRWRHPTLGDISPGEFIPLAEQTSLIHGLTRWVLDRAIEHCARWRHEGYPLGVSINVSARDLESAAFCDTLDRLLRQHGVPSSAIELEFTESAVMKDPALVADQLARVTNLGVQIAIDDFGAGYSNWNYLRQLPADTIKLDQSFLHNLDGQEKTHIVIRSMIDTARALGYQVVAEGIETQEQYHLMTTWGCQQGQGYCIARPLEFDALLSWWRDRR